MSVPKVFETNWDGGNVLAHNPAGVIAAIVKGFDTSSPPPVADTAYYNLGIPRDGDVKIAMSQKPDTRLRPDSWGHMFDAKWSSMQANYGAIILMNKFKIAAPISFQLALTSGKYIHSDKYGVIPRLVCGGKFEDSRLIEYSIKGAVKRSELSSFIDETPVTAGTPTPTDMFYPFSQIEHADDVEPNGLEKVEFKASNEDGYALGGDIEEGKYTVEPLVSPSGGGRETETLHGFKIMMDCMFKETNIEKVALLATASDHFTEFKFTHMDGLVLTLPYTNFRGKFDFESVGNVDKAELIRLHVEGSITDLSDSGWGALWTAPS